eukprot:TRINITY_DN403_c2_g2_i1.p1 TRINITY_DN403_c2_g2~~TRINITY_DN403_c2_g2_i1.p1  ORF type:complete len:275 (-),score=6.59 TRINITY_DN403_c2_g2_i1:798-1622(-)
MLASVSMQMINQKEKQLKSRSESLMRGGKLSMLPFLLGEQTIYQARRELEPVQSPDDQAEIQHIALRSKVSICKARISFVNCTELIVGALWVNHLGQEVTYGLIKPHKETIYSTYTYHPWVIRSVGDGSRMCLVTRQRDQQHCQSIQRAQQVVMCTRASCLLQVFIYKPPIIPWEISRHSLFFESGDQLIESLQQVLESKGIHDQDFMQFLVNKMLGYLAPQLNYDIALHGNLVVVDEICGISANQKVRPMMIPNELQSLILQHPQVLKRRFLQ